MDMVCTIPNGRKDRLTLTSTLGIGNVGRKDWLMLTSALGNDNVGRKDWLTLTSKYTGKSLLVEKTG